MWAACKRKGVKYGLKSAHVDKKCFVWEEQIKANRQIRLFYLTEMTAKVYLY